MLSFLGHYVTKKVVVRIIAFIIRRTENPYDDVFLEEKVFNRLAHIVPAIILYRSIEIAFPGDPVLIRYITHGVDIYVTWMMVLSCTAFISGFDKVYHSLPVSIETPLKGYLQVFKIICYIIGITIILSLLLGVSPFKLLSGIGAMAAVILLVFKDTILGFIASIQLTGYKMVKVGDWITMPSQNADGKVLEISINTVRVQNFDLSISMIPTYTMVSQSFVNWRGLEEVGGRRIKRSLSIDMKTIKFCNREMLERFKTIDLVAAYASDREKDIDVYEKKIKKNDQVSLINDFTVTNLTVLRHYIENYLKHCPFINQEMSCIVRPLQPTAKGLPIEIYAFCVQHEFEEYEAIQSDLFDHILAIIPLFDLKVHQDAT